MRGQCVKPVQRQVKWPASNGTDTQRTSWNTTTIRAPTPLLNHTVVLLKALSASQPISAGTRQNYGTCSLLHPFLLPNRMTVPLGLWSNLFPFLCASFLGTSARNWSSSIAHPRPELPASSRCHRAQVSFVCFPPDDAVAHFHRNWNRCLVSVLCSGIINNHTEGFKQAWTSHLPVSMSLSNPDSAPTYS